jgi:Ca-activated chloride channel family protein
MFDWQSINSFYFVWPWALLLLLLIPVGWALYLQQIKRKLRQTALNFSQTALIAKLRREPAPWKRLLAPMLSSIIAGCMIISLARPTVVARVPINAVDMMLVLDISLSMMADDIHPNRLEAAKEAAIQFVRRMPRDSRIGLEVFAGDTYVLTPPTSHHSEVEAYLAALRKEDLKPRTQMGSAIETALQTLRKAEAKPEAKENKPSTDKQTAAEPTEEPNATKKQAKKPSRVIILMSDGDSHEGYPWDQAARDALGDNVIINTIGIGSSQGGTITYKGMELPVNFDETTLRRIAEIANGDYFRVYQQNDFSRVYRQIQEKTVHYEEREIDLGFILAGMGLLSLLIGLAASLLI